MIVSLTLSLLSLRRTVLPSYVSGEAPPGQSFHIDRSCAGSRGRKRPSSWPLNSRPPRAGSRAWVPTLEFMERHRFPVNRHCGWEAARGSFFRPRALTTRMSMGPIPAAPAVGAPFRTHPWPGMTKSAIRMSGPSGPLRSARQNRCPQGGCAAGLPAPQGGFVKLSLEGSSSAIRMSSGLSALSARVAGWVRSHVGIRPDSPGYGDGRQRSSRPRGHRTRPSAGPCPARCRDGSNLPGGGSDRQP